MRKLTLAVLLAAQTVGACEPVLAAELIDAPVQQVGAFGGVRLRVPLDGHASRRQVLAGLALAPTLHMRAGNGATQLRFGEGLELGVAGRQPLRLRLAGQDLRRLGAAGQEEERQQQRRGGPSTIGWIAIGLGIAAVVVVGAAAICASDSDCIPSE